MADDLNCSDGAKMLIERMQSNPEEFKNNYDGRWRDILDAARNVANEDEYGEVMSKRDAAAILTAYDAHILEPRLAERIIKELMEPKKSKQDELRGKNPTHMLTSKEMERYARQLLDQEYMRKQQAQGIAAQQGMVPGALGNQMGRWWR